MFGRQYSKDEDDTVRPNPTPITMNKTKIDSAMSIKPKKNPSYPSQGRNKIYFTINCLNIVKTLGGVRHMTRCTRISKPKVILHCWGGRLTNQNNFCRFVSCIHRLSLFLPAIDFTVAVDSTKIAFSVKKTLSLSFIMLRLILSLTLVLTLLVRGLDTIPMPTVGSLMAKFTTVPTTSFEFSFWLSYKGCLFRPWFL